MADSAPLESSSGKHCQPTRGTTLLHVVLNAADSDILCTLPSCSYVHVKPEKTFIVVEQPSPPELLRG